MGKAMGITGRVGLRGFINFNKHRFEVSDNIYSSRDTTNKSIGQVVQGVHPDSILVRFENQIRLSLK
jgi:hypothetical protein